MNVDSERYVGGEDLEGDRLWWQFDSGIVKGEWLSRWLGVGGGVCGLSVSLKALRDGSVQGVMRVSSTLDQEVLQEHQHECSGANRSAESRPADSRRETMNVTEEEEEDDDDDD